MKYGPAIVIILVVFGLAGLLIIRGHDPTVVMAVVTATSLAAAELVRHIRERPPPPEQGSGSGEAKP